MRGSIQGSGGTRGRVGAFCSTLVLAALAVPAAASGDLIYVAPDDESSGFFCSESQPCGITVGINLAPDDDDEILLAPGTYETNAELEIPSSATNVTIRPRDPGTRPVIASTATIALQLSGADATVRGIDIDHDNIAATGIFALASGSRIRNVFSVSNGDTPCQMSNGTITDSICLATAPTGRALRVSIGGGDVTTVIRNATLLSTGIFGAGIYASANTANSSVSLDIASSIVAGDGFDVETETFAPTATVDADLAASNFETRAVDAGATVTDPATAGNQTEEPIFVGFGLEQAPNSPTVDAGLVDDETGSTDVYGDQRPQGAGNDIGADELPDTVAPKTRIKKKPKRRTSSRRAKFVFVSNEPGAEFECKVDKGGFEKCSSRLKLKKLKPRRHKLSVRAIDTAGNIDATPAEYRWTVKPKK